MARTKQSIGTLVRIPLLVACGLLASACSSASNAEDTASSAESLTRAQESWREVIARVPTAAEGCFHASYPNIEWEPADCTAAPARPYLPKRSVGPDTVGDGADFGVQTTSIITQAVGTFPSVTGVKKETDGSSNDYSIQLNSNFMSKARCSNIAGCQAWEQFVYSSSSQSAFMQYWLIGQGKCPSGGWMAYENDCYMNSAATRVPKFAITGLSTMKMSGSAANGGKDTLVFTANGEAYGVTGKDSVVELGLDWMGAEFNVIGDGNGSQATFNTGSSITVKLALTDGSTAAPTCVANGGTTGETNNLNLGKCTATGGSTPSIQYTQSN